MATSWIYKFVPYDVGSGEGWHQLNPNQQHLENALNEIAEYANQNGYRVTSTTHIQGQAYYASNRVGGSVVHNNGVWLVVFLEQ